VQQQVTIILTRPMKIVPQQVTTNSPPKTSAGCHHGSKQPLTRCLYFKKYRIQSFEEKVLMHFCKREI